MVTQLFLFFLIFYFIFVKIRGCSVESYLLSDGCMRSWFAAFRNPVG